MGGFSYARIVSNGQRYVSVLLTFLHKVGGQLLVLLIFLPTLELFNVPVVKVSKESNLIRHETFVELPNNYGLSVY